MFASNAIAPTEALKRCIDRLPAKDQEFAASLLSAPHPSPKQLHWIEQLAEPAATTEPTKPLAGFIAIYQMMHRASEKLQHPKVLAKASDITIRLTLAGERSKTPGAINVTAPEAPATLLRSLADRPRAMQLSMHPMRTGSTLCT